MVLGHLTWHAFATRKVAFDFLLVLQTFRYFWEHSRGIIELSVDVLVIGGEMCLDPCPVWLMNGDSHLNGWGKFLDGAILQPSCSSVLKYSSFLTA